MLHRACSAVILAVSLLLFAAIQAEGAEPIWPMYRGNPQRTGRTEWKGPSNMRVRWQVNLHREICASPAVGADGTVYLGAGTNFYAISPEGRIIWTHNFAESGQAKPPRRDNATSDNSGFTSPSPAIGAEGTIYQDGGMNSQGCIMALNPHLDAAKRLLWTYGTTTEMRSSPLIAGKSCIVADSADRFLLSLDPAGQLEWKSGVTGLYASGSSPALSLDGKCVYVGGLDDRLHAFEITTGKALWRVGPDEPRALRLEQRDAHGEIVRHFTTRGHIPDAAAVGGDGTIYFGSWDGYLYAATPEGKLRWAIDLQDRVSSAPAVAKDGTVLVSTYEGRLCAVREKDGQPVLVWTAEAGSRYSAPLVTSDGRVYVGGLDGEVRAYDLASGRLVDELALGRGWVHASPVPGGDGLLYVGCSDGFLRAIESGPPKQAAAAKETPVAQAASLPQKTFHSKVVVPEFPSRPADFAEAVRVARACMDEADPKRRAEWMAQAGGWDERLDEIAAALRPVPPADAPRGYLPEDKFQVPRVRARMVALRPKLGGPVLPFAQRGAEAKASGDAEEHLNFVHVPETYDPKKPLGLVISLHGGAGSSPQSSARALQEGAYWDASRLHADDFISVCPSTPPQIPTKFGFPESEIHFQSIIEEYSTRYAIDPNRIYLTGFSMGGIGSWWEAFRQPDRFAVIAPRAGRWTTAYWPKLRGTELCLMNGAFDFHLHVDYTRIAHERLNACGVPHIDMEYPGAHSMPCSSAQMIALFDLFRAVKRDPYPPRICAVSPFVPEGDVARYPSQPYAFWAAVLEPGPGAIPVEARVSDESRTYEGGGEGKVAWSRKGVGTEWRLMKAGAIDAQNLGGNRFRVEETNVKRFALWLHPKMGVDFTRPIEVELVHMEVDPAGKTTRAGAHELLRAKAQPSLAAMLRYLADRRDFGLIYHSVVEFEIER